MKTTLTFLLLAVLTNCGQQEMPARTNLEPADIVWEGSVLDSGYAGAFREAEANYLMTKEWRIRK